MCSWQAWMSDTAQFHSIVVNGGSTREMKLAAGDLEGDTFCQWRASRRTSDGAVAVFSGGTPAPRQTGLGKRSPEAVSRSPRASPEAKLTTCGELNQQFALLALFVVLDVYAEDRHLLRNVRREFQQSCFGQLIKQPSEVKTTSPELGIQSGSVANLVQFSVCGVLMTQEPTTFSHARSGGRAVRRSTAPDTARGSERQPRLQAVWQSWAASR